MTTTIDAAAIESLLAAPSAPGISGIKAKCRALEAATGLQFADYAQYGCRPGTCKCPTRFARCRMWERFEVAARETAGIPEPEKPRIFNRHGVDVTGRIYSSKMEALRDLCGSPDND